uniref:ATP synthase F0 subunit 8 n=1 Tax=Tanna japonensis TaxID=678707 RepID=A0A344ALX2_9HEMI|nr:ATP synthase F0 subunit 8 [Tanna japonensis]
MPQMSPIYWLMLMLYFMMMMMILMMTIYFFFNISPPMNFSLYKNNNLMNWMW